jgi:hypothetical protein
VQATSQAECQKVKLEKELRTAEERLDRVTLSGKGRKIWNNEEELRGAIATLEQEHGVEGFLAVELSQETLEPKNIRQAGQAA